ncbi:TetR/AcrR family transcriptional regulator [Paraburkholderia sediminicola]|uniref:TetR/AcrR family transcriptional regulator n=1 Tax=Paraburkholderia sediminicola TaxID=458836 RepID=UPI0038BBC3F1
MEQPSEINSTASSGQRGPVEHERRTQILKAADEHFRRYGYSKTSVADLGRAIGVSTAYIYRFFESKQAIGEAIVSLVLGEMDLKLHDIAVEGGSATNRLRKLLATLMQHSCDLFLQDRKLHDIVIVAVENGWCAVGGHDDALDLAIKRVITDGREIGEFERKTPVDDICRAIVASAQSFSHPRLLEHKSREELEQKLQAVTSLVLRSLSP